MLKYFELCELLAEPTPLVERTHPPAAHRWERVKTHTRLSEAPGALALNLDLAFSVLMRGLPVGK